MVAWRAAARSRVRRRGGSDRAIRRGVRPPAERVPQMVLDGPDERGDVAGGPQHRIDQIGRGGLAVGAGDAGKAECARRADRRSSARPARVPGGHARRGSSAPRNSGGDLRFTDHGQGSAREPVAANCVRRRGCRERRKRGSPLRRGANRSRVLRRKAKQVPAAVGRAAERPRGTRSRSSRKLNADALPFMERRRPAGGVLHRASPLPLGLTGDPLAAAIREHHTHGLARRNSGPRTAPASAPSGFAVLPRPDEGIDGRCRRLVVRSSRIFGGRICVSAIGQIARHPPRLASAGASSSGNVFRHFEDAQGLRGHCFETRGGRLSAKPKPCRGSVKRHHHHDRRVGDRREAQEGAVVAVRVVLASRSRKFAPSPVLPPTV